MSNYSPAVKKKLSESGCYCYRQGKGDHEMWTNPETGAQFPVDHKIKSRHTANGILKRAGLEKEF